jgi:hypothetical protein
MIAFELSMPGVGSWDGRWSGSGRNYVLVRPLGRSATAVAREVEIVSNSPYRYDFGDGWAASVTARAVDAKEARRLRANSAGFAGYDWMVHEILTDGRIRSLSERATA